ncbi:hypothetical protein O3P69_006233 [Scylla paramamosain]|uniref:Ionotropic glutamate receptor C-terminal domain-containing protein n=1 Tax=Scylla paramamosain TaxID=85552 RepID=A0AAW0U9M9_SCYPA
MEAGASHSRGGQYGGRLSCGLTCIRWRSDINLEPSDHLRATASAWLPRGGERLAAGVWLLLSLVLAQMYRSNLKAMMILPRLSLPFDSLEELIESGIICYIVPDTLLHKRIMDAASGNRFGRLRPQLLVHKDFSAATRDVVLGKHAAMASHLSILHIIHTIFQNTGTCPVYLASETLQEEWNYFLYQKDSPWRPKVDVIVRSLKESGILEKMFQERQQDGRHCLTGRATDVPASRSRALKFKDFYGVLMMYCGGVMLASVTLLMEVLFRGVKTSASHHKPNHTDQCRSASTHPCLGLFLLWTGASGQHTASASLE